MEAFRNKCNGKEEVFVSYQFAFCTLYKRIDTESRQKWERVLKRSYLELEVL